MNEKDIEAWLESDFQEAQANKKTEATERLEEARTRRSRQEAESIAQESHDRRQRAQRIQNVVLTTTNHIEAHQVVKYIGIESVEYIVGTGFFSGLGADVADFFGARASLYEQKLAEGKSKAMDMLKHRAAEQGANAVIGVDIDYNVLSGDVLCLVVNGTMVKVKRRDELPQQTSEES